MSHRPGVRRSLFPVVVLALLTMSATGACTSCDEYASAGLTLDVVDGDGDPICDATVTATDGEYVEVVEVQSPAPRCSYAGAWERSGAYTVEVVTTSGARTTRELEVDSGRCHVKGVVETITVDT